MIQLTTEPATLPRLAAATNAQAAKESASSSPISAASDCIGSRVAAKKAVRNRPKQAASVLKHRPRDRAAKPAILYDGGR